MPFAPFRRLGLAAASGAMLLLVLAPGSAFAAFGQYVLRPGTTDHADVRVLQLELNRLGYHLAVDGIYGYGTELAVEAFQRAHGIPGNGVVAARTFDALRRASITTSRGEVSRGQVYVVQSGDSFSSIAVKFQVTVAALESANPTVSPTALQIGASILIPPGAPAPQAPATSTFGQELARIALKYLGVRYVYGAADPSVGFDCSGFVYFLAQQLGVTLPRTSTGQYQVGVSVPEVDLQPGDLVFFDTGYFASHVGIYEGNGQFAQAENWGTVTHLSNLNSPYWSSRYIGAKRISP